MGSLRDCAGLLLACWASLPCALWLLCLAPCPTGLLGTLLEVGSMGARPQWSLLLVVSSVTKVSGGGEEEEEGSLEGHAVLPTAR